MRYGRILVSAFIYETLQNYDCFHGKELSYNNYLDIDSALRLYEDFYEMILLALQTYYTQRSNKSSKESIQESTTDKVSPLENCAVLLFRFRYGKSHDSIFTEILSHLSIQMNHKVVDSKKNRRLFNLRTKTRHSKTISLYFWVTSTKLDNVAIKPPSKWSNDNPLQEIQDILFTLK